MADVNFTYSGAKAAFEYPCAPGYGNGCSSGKAAHLAFIKYLQGDDYKVSCGGSLQLIVLNLAAELHRAKTEGERAAVRGKIVGAFSELEKWLHYAAKNGSNADSRDATPENIQGMLQDAADGGPENRYEAKVRKEESARNRSNALAGWVKRKASAAATSATTEVPHA